MSNKAKTMKKNKHTLTPKLRFPEFRDEPGWEERPLLEVLSEHGCKSTGLEQVFSVSVHKGIVNQIEHLGRSFSASSTNHYNRVRPGDVVYTKSPTGDFPLGIVKQSKLDFPVIVSPLYGVFSPETTGLGVILDAYFESPANTKAFLEPLVQTGAKNTINIKNSRFLSGSLILPVNKEEQRKIGDFLNSLDVLIAAEGRKLEALRDHKRGLMQQLFPQPGQSQPRLRFPEFKDKGGWENVSLGSICKIQRGKFSHRPRNDPKFFGGPYAFIQTGDVVRANGGAVAASQSLNELGLSVSKLFKPTIVLITIAANIGDTAILESEACFTDSVVGLIPKSDRVTPRFLESIVRLKKDHLNQIATTGAQKNINNEILGTLTVLAPSIDEQSRIEYCLSSLDNQISAQAAKIDTLKTHKRGLMQQLFPTPQEQ